MPKPKHTLITQEQFDLLSPFGYWNIYEVRKKDWALIPRVQRLEDTFGIMASGSIEESRILNGINAVVGLDVLVCEPNPSREEPEGNAYHYVVQASNDPRWPFIIHGPYPSGTLVGHWFEFDELNRYLT